MRNHYRRSTRTVRRCDALMKALVPVLLTLGGVAPLVLFAQPPAAAAPKNTALANMERRYFDGLREYERTLQQQPTNAYYFANDPEAQDDPGPPYVDWVEIEGEYEVEWIDPPGYYKTTWTGDGRLRLHFEDGTAGPWVQMSAGLELVEGAHDGYYTQWA